jgi:hypothetical protein
MNFGLVQNFKPSEAPPPSSAAMCRDIVSQNLYFAGYLYKNLKNQSKLIERGTSSSFELDEL